MPKRKIVVQSQQEKDAVEETESSSNILMIADSVLTIDTCDVIIEQLSLLPVENVQQEENGQICPDDLSALDRSW